MKTFIDQMKAVRLRHPRGPEAASMPYCDLNQMRSWFTRLTIAIGT